MANIYYNYSGAFLPGTLARAEAVAAEYTLVQKGFDKISNQGIDTGTANHYAFTTPGYPVAAYQDGNNVQFKALNTNTGASDVNVNGIGVVPLTRFNGAALLAGDVSAGSWYIAVYQVAFGAFTIISPAAYTTFAGTISGAAPAHKVGLTAAGGSATSAIPIDATLAIDQAISPTWTGEHSFSNALQVTGSSFAGFAGQGVELSVSAGAGVVLSYDRTALAYKPMQLLGSTIALLIGATTALSVSAAGSVTIAAPSSGVALSVTGVAGASAAQFLTTGVQIGSPTGGDKGAGTLNVSSGLYVNNVLVANGAVVTSVVAGTAISVSGATGAVTINNTGVTSITGTANQIAASASTGAVTLSIPTNPQLPGAVITGQGLQVQGAGTTGFTGNGIELSGGSTGTLLAFNRTGSAYLPIQISGSTVGLAIGATNALLVDASSNVNVPNGTGTLSPVYAGIPQNVQNASYQFVLADANKHIFHNTATGGHTYTIPANASVAFPVGTAITIVNPTGAGILTLAITSDALQFYPSGGTGSRTLAASSQVTILKVTATVWSVSGVGIT